MPEDVRRSFAPVAANYSRSAFHAAPERLQEVVDLAQLRGSDRVLDVATGTGHTALALAPHVTGVVGLDLTAEMLQQARRVASERGVANVEWVLGDACRLPVADSAFDLYAVRAAPHHFQDVPAALAEAYRVLKPGGRAIFVDCAPPAAARDHLHEVEVARDPSHVRSHTVDEWSALIEEAGLVVERADRRELDWDFEAWMGNMAVPAARVAVLAKTVERASGRAREQLRPERRAGRLFHAYWHALIRARRPW